MSREANGDGQIRAAEARSMRPGRGSPGRRKVTAALLVAMMVTAMEQLVVSPAMPTIIAQLKGFEIYPWVDLGLPAGIDREHADLRQARRPVRPQADPALRPGPLQRRARCSRERPRAWGS